VGVQCCRRVDAVARPATYRGGAKNEGYPETRYMESFANDVCSRESGLCPVLAIDFPALEIASVHVRYEKFPLRL
jgi:hypothetical protein